MRRVAALALIAATAAIPAFGNPVPMPGVENPARARQNWILKCQGCHRADASGTPETTPAMAGIIGSFLTIPEGRVYLARVPGVATAALSDAAVAEVLNWTLLRFDPEHIPADFKPYSAAEIAELRQKPLRTETAAVRADLMARIESKGKQQK